MATAKQTVDILSYLTGERRNRVNALAREMINSGLLPISSGRDIRQVPPSSAALLLFAVAFSERTADASTVAKKMRRLPCPAESGKRLGDVVAAVLSGKLAASNVDLHRDSTGHFSAAVHLILPGGNKSQMRFHTKHGGGVFWQTTRSINEMGLRQLQYVLSRTDLPEGVEFAGVRTMEASGV
jgi:hypothetical protein